MYDEEYLLRISLKEEQLAVCFSNMFPNDYIKCESLSSNLELSCFKQQKHVNLCLYSI